MKIDLRTLAVTAMTAAWLVACGSEGTEPNETTTNELGSSCVGDIEAPVGSAAWRAELDACIAKQTGAGGSACQSSIQCTNGVCKCGSGPNASKVCDGTTKTGAGSCTVMCSSCVGSSSSPAPTPAPPPPPPSGGNGGNGESCRTGIQCTNGVCTCTDGPRTGDTCDGTSKTGANACSVLCKVCD